MRKITLLTISITCFIFSSNSQELKATYKFDFPVEGNGIQYKAGHKVKVVDTSNTDLISFVYLKFKDKKIRAKKLNAKYYYKRIDTLNSFSITNNNKVTNDSLDIEIHTISKTKFKNATTRHYYYHRFKGVKAGIYTVPFKLRLDDFDFEQNVNLGMSLSFRFRMNRKHDSNWLLSPTLGIGLSTVKLNPKNSDIEEGEDSNRTASAFSLSGGILFELKENINLSLQYGFDFLGNDDKDINWKYNKKPWLGIGVNIGFPIAKDKVENENDKNK